MIDTPPAILQSPLVELVHDIPSHNLKMDLTDAALPKLSISQIEICAPILLNDRNDKLLPTLEKFSMLNNAVDLIHSAVDKPLPTVRKHLTDKHDPDLNTS
jgi:hypothetical protein